MYFWCLELEFHLNNLCQHLIQTFTTHIIEMKFQNYD